MGTAEGNDESSMAGRGGKVSYRKPGDARPRRGRAT